MNQSDNIIKAIFSVIDEPTPVPLHVPEFDGSELDYVTQCITTGWVSSVGSYVERFEKMLADNTGVSYAIACVSGTAALHAALVALDIKAGDEVLVPALTFVATANAVSYTGATPHFCDSDAERLGIDVVKLASYLEIIAEHIGNDGKIPIYKNKHTGHRLRAIVPMHVFGMSVDMDGLLKIAEKYGLVVIEDAAESLGSTYKGKPLGGYGHVGVLSFNGNKIITTGGGGAILTNDEALAKKIKHLTMTAKKIHPWIYDHDMVGFNYRLPNINAALGCAQLEQLESKLKLKRRLAVAYEKAFEKIDNVKFMVEPDDSKSNYWLNAIKIEGDWDNEMRDQLLKSLHEGGVLCRPVWNLLPSMEIYMDCPSMNLSIANDLVTRIINIPSSARLAKNIDK